MKKKYLQNIIVSINSSFNNISMLILTPDIWNDKVAFSQFQFPYI